MKKLLISAIAACLAIPGMAGELSLLPKPKKGSQQWIVIGARAGVNSTWLMNNNLMSDKGIKYRASFGGGGGIMLGIHLSNVVAIEGECLYSLVNQKFKSKVDSVAWTSKVNLAYLEFPVLLHFDFESFKYLELGVKFGMIQSAKESFDYPKYPTVGYTNKDTKPAFEKSNMALVFGWGTGLWGNGGLMVNFGIRATYGLSDIISAAGGVGGVNGSLLNQGRPKGDPYWSYGEAAAKGYKPTNTATIGFHFNIDFDLGWFMSSNCGRKHTFVLFGH